jgi:hypothetical protein
MKWTSSSSHWNVACTHHEVDIMTLVQATFQCDDDDVHFMVNTSYMSMWWWCPLHGEYKLHVNVMMSTSWWVQATFQCDDDDVHFMSSTSYISMWWWCPLSMKWTSSSHWHVACIHHEADIIIITLKCSLYSPWSGHHHQHHIKM